jgi:hypothetical protein
MTIMTVQQLTIYVSTVQQAADGAHLASLYLLELLRFHPTLAFPFAPVQLLLYATLPDPNLGVNGTSKLHKLLQKLPCHSP